VLLGVGGVAGGADETGGVIAPTFSGAGGSFGIGWVPVLGEEGDSRMRTGGFGISLLAEVLREPGRTVWSARLKSAKVL